MRRTRLVLPLGLAVLVSACQAAPAPSGTAPTPTAAPSGVAAGPSANPAASATPSATPAPAAQFVQISGKVVDDDGRLLDATVEVVGADGAVLRSTTAISGSYVLPDMAVDQTVRLRAKTAGYTVRERLVTPQLPNESDDRDPNVIDFGGFSNGLYYALSSYPEISSVSPANKQTGVASSPLVVTFNLSHPLPAAGRGRFGKLLQLRFQVPTSVDPSGFLTIRAGTAYGEDIATLTWNEAGDVGTFKFGAPLVTRQAEATAVTIGFDEDALIEDWPEATNNKPLGRGRAPSTWHGSGASISGRVAPFWRGAEGFQVPTTRPSPLNVWGSTHAIDSTFSLAPDTKQPKVVSVAAYRGQGSAEDQIVVTFDEPMRGFPESALDGTVLRPSNFRYVLGKTEESDDKRDYQKADPASGGNVPTLPPRYSPTRRDTVILPLPNGTLGDNTVFKLYVDPGVKDLAGNSIQTATPDAQNHLSINVLEGSII